MFTLGRKIDLSYKTNQLIVSLVLILALTVWLTTNEITIGLLVAGGVFLSWALSRELDPAHDYSAFVAAALSLFILYDIQSIQLLPLFWLLMLLRTVNGITGKELTLLDIAAILGFTVYLSFSNENSFYSLVFVFAMLFTSYTRERTKLFVLTGTLGFILFVLQSYWTDSLSFSSVENLSTLNSLALGASILSPFVFWFLSRKEIENDQGNRADPSKIFASQLLFSICAFLFVSFTDISSNNHIIYLAVVIGISIYYIGTILYSKL